MTSDELEAQAKPVLLYERTKRFALAVLKFAPLLPRHYSADVIGRQLVRCATSVGANYRAACRAKSSADFIAKMKIVEEEADESLYWLELLRESGFVGVEAVEPLYNEGRQILAMVVASIKTKRANQ